MHGVFIQLSYLDNNSEFTSFDWIQTVERTDEAGNVEIFTDPKGSKAAGHWPYYYSSLELSDPFFAPLPGYDDLFKDEPLHETRSFYQYFKAELTFVGVDKSNKIIPLMTFKYGFEMQSGAKSATPFPLRAAGGAFLHPAGDRGLGTDLLRFRIARHASRGRGTGGVRDRGNERLPRS